MIWPASTVGKQIHNKQSRNPLLRMRLLFWIVHLLEAVQPYNLDFEHSIQQAIPLDNKLFFELSTSFKNDLIVRRAPGGLAI